MNGPRTHHDGTIDNVSRSVYMKAMTRLDSLLDNTAANTELIVALAQAADASWCGVIESEEQTI